MILLRILALALLLALPAQAYTGPNQSARIAVLIGANFNTTSDQAIPVPAQISAYRITNIFVTNCSANMTTAVGGIYTAASKGGTALVSAAQVYSALTGATVLLPLTIAVTTTRLTAAPIYLSLTVAQGGAATCDVHVFGDDLS